MLINFTGEKDEKKIIPKRNSLLEKGKGGKCRKTKVLFSFTYVRK